MKTIEENEEIMPHGDPDGTRDDPASLPYSAPFKFQNGSTTNAFETSSSSITVELQNAYLTTNRSAKITIRSYHWNGSTWIEDDSDSVTINGTKNNYSVTLSVTSNVPLYVRLSKTDYTGYYAEGTIYIS